MLLYVAVCLAATLTGGDAVPNLQWAFGATIAQVLSYCKACGRQWDILYMTSDPPQVCTESKPTWGATVSLRLATYSPGYGYDEMNMWIDRVNNRSRMDFLNTQEQCLYQQFDQEWQTTTLHRVFPVTTEEYKNVKKCFVAGGFEAMLYSYAFYLFPDMTNYHFVGIERMHGVEAKKWRTEFRWKIRPDFSVEITLWVAERQGASVPLRRVDVYNYNEKNHKSRGVQYFDFFDYDTRDIDPEVWDIGAGLKCKVATDYEINDPDFSQEVSLLTEDFEKQFEFFDNFGPKLSYFAKFGETKKDYKKNQGLAFESRQSKGLPFPYTAEEVKRLSAKLPEQFDWRMYGAITPVPVTKVMYQQRDYATVAANVVEGALFLKRGRETLVPLSLQAIVDCSWGFGNRGINGGSVEASYEWMMKYGLPKASDYPDVDRNDNCIIDEVKIETRVKGYYTVPRNDKDALKVALVNHGPIAVLFDGLDLNNDFGIFNDTDRCLSGPSSGNEYGTLVGYGVLEGEEYWIIKGTYLGYVQITTRDNTCGVMNSPTYVALE